jgi:hypothetical protein
VEEVDESAQKKHATGRLMMTTTSCVHAILHASKASDYVFVLDVHVRDELNECGNISQVENKDIDLFLWWSMHAVQFPTLSKIARQFLAQLATSAACERIFNRAGRIHDNFKKGSLESTLNHTLLVSMNP